MLVAVWPPACKDNCYEEQRGKQTLDQQSQCHDVRAMKFRRDTIFNDRLLLALCVGTAIFGLVALTLLG